MVWNVHLLRYLWEVREELPGNRRQKKQILSRVESSVQDFVIENPHVDYATITQRFGTPQQIAASYIEEMSTPELTQQLRIRKTIVRIVAVDCVGACFAVGWCGFNCTDKTHKGHGRVSYCWGSRSYKQNRLSGGKVI